MQLKYFLSAIIFINLASCKNDDKPADNPVVGNNNSIANISYSIVNTFPHDTASFTQGLAIYKGQLYEGTGGDDADKVSSKGSRLMKVNLQTGKVEKELKLPGNAFGEGITIVNDTVYQLTWKNKIVYAYTLPDFKKIKEFPINTEGWGITTNGKDLIVSDGSSNIYFYEPGTFRLLRTQSITQNGELSFNLNELEYIDGYLYANQWQQPYIFKIEPNSGQVVARIDLSQAWARIKNIDPYADVPNGIAYDADTKKIYITGKKWPELYEIQLGQ
ncbi:MAG: glutaminyl-peptide cyclotransferase [Niabella sp.]